MWCVYCSDHYGGLVHKRDELARQKLHSQKRYQQAMEVAQNDNKKVGFVSTRKVVYKRPH